MPFRISPASLKQQAKVVVKEWPFQSIQTARARDILCKLYGYRDNHHFRKILFEDYSLAPLDKDVLLHHYPILVKKLADLGSMNQIQARQLLHKLWPHYLNNSISPGQKLYSSEFFFRGNCKDFLNTASDTVSYHFDDRPSVKDAIEAIGIPHPEVGDINVNGVTVDFGYQLQNHDSVEVLPCTSGCTLPYLPEGKITFLLDVHLAGLARYLRMAGFDCLHDKKDHGDALLAATASGGDYILLTRDIGLLKRGIVKYGHWVREVTPELQFREIIRHYRLEEQFRPLSLCIKCNGDIQPALPEKVADKVPDDLLKRETDFRQCTSCHQVYWKGSHYMKIMRILENARQPEDA